MNLVEETWDETMKKKKKKKKSSRKETYFLASATEDETAVSQILLQLGNLFMTVEARPKFVWGCRKRRSCLDESPSFNSGEPTSKSLASVQKSDGEDEVKVGRFKEEEGPPAAAAASSPATPLSFSSSESDEKSNLYSKNASKKKSEYIDLIQRLTHHGDSLRMEIENARKHHHKLKVCNSELKAMKQEILKAWRRKEEPQMEGSRFVNLGFDLTQHYRITLLPPQQPFISDLTATFGPITTNPKSCLSNNGHESVKLVGQTRIPDLNLSAEEAFAGVDSSQPLDVVADRRARFAEARRMRRGIIKIKSMRRACGIK